MKKKKKKMYLCLQQIFVGQVEEISDASKQEVICFQMSQCLTNPFNITVRISFSLHHYTCNCKKIKYLFNE